MSAINLKLVEPSKITNLRLSFLELIVFLVARINYAAHTHVFYIHYVPAPIFKTANA